MYTIERTIEVRLPARAVYDHWTRFQDFPEFMQGIRKVSAIDEQHLHWTAEVGGKAQEWDAEILEQVAGQRIAWRSTTGAENSGTLDFIALTPVTTRLILYLRYAPRGIFEHLGANLGLVSAKVTGDLNRFKNFVESRSAPAKTEGVAMLTQPAGA